jgi:hypothetical protein
VAELVEPYLRSVRGLTRPIRLAMLRGTDAFGLELSSLVASELAWNGKSVTENGSNYQGYTFDELTTPEIVDKLLDFVPDLIVSTAGDEVTHLNTGLVWDLDTKWKGLVKSTQEEPNPPLPFYILSPFNAGASDSVIKLFEAEASGSDQKPWERYIGITAASAANLTLQNDYAVNVRAKFMGADPDTGNFYDAYYFLAYAMYAAHVNDPRGADIARGMHRLLEGDPYNVGFADIAKITAALKDEDSTIELNGTLGPPDFDKKGIHVDPGSVYCFLDGGSGVTYFPDALRYDRAAGMFDGSFPCFTGFKD